uniref:Uncharacterized protein n=1 Tax=Rhizophora mucronata TaxID=61149 RepID=A0A2P2QDJ6_RHIMU
MLVVELIIFVLIGRLNFILLQIFKFLPSFKY